MLDYSERAIPENERIQFMQDFEKLHNLADHVDNKMSYYACFLGDEGIRKVVLVVRVMRSAYLHPRTNDRLDFYHKEAAGDAVGQCPEVHYGPEANPGVPADPEHGDAACPDPVDSDQEL